jgi:hypothetical protein
VRRAEEDEIGNYSDDVSLGRLSGMGNDFRFGPLNAAVARRQIEIQAPPLTARSHRAEGNQHRLAAAEEGSGCDNYVDAREKF